VDAIVVELLLLELLLVAVLAVLSASEAAIHTIRRPQLIEELAALYAGASTGVNAELPAPMPFSRYASRLANRTDAERETVEAGLRSSDAFTLRRSQIILASARGEWAPHIAQHLGCDAQTVRNVIQAFNARGLACLQPGSRCAHTIHRAFEEEAAERLRALLHISPRTFGKPTGVWTLPLAAEVSFAQGITPTRMTGETIRVTLKRLGIGWRRAKRWITSPDPEYAAKKAGATD